MTNHPSVVGDRTCQDMKECETIRKFVQTGTLGELEPLIRLRWIVLPNLHAQECSKFSVLSLGAVDLHAF